MSTPSRDLALRVVELACRAPSVHNTQPWRWRLVDDATVELHADRTRQLLVSDPSGRNLAISCGAALHHAHVAARALGLSPAIDLLPSPGDPDLLARLTLAPGTSHEDDEEALRALEARRTDRRRFTSWPVPDARLAHLADAAAGWGAHAIPVTDVTARFRAEELVGRAVAAQAADPRYAEEQHTWTERSPADGLPLANAAPATTEAAPTGTTTRPNRYAPPDAPVLEDPSLVEPSDGLIAVCTGTDGLLAWLRTGETLSALWLQATREGLSVVPLTQVVEVEETRLALHEEVFDGMARPQILVRVGWLESSRAPLAATPRRPIDDVVES
jgi:hypothetical protein